MSEQPSVAILAGGDSRRMGRNKALLRLPPSGDTMIRTIARHVTSLTDDLLIIGPALPEFLDLPARTIPDAGVRAGPLSGIATALTVARHPTCLIVACDLPLLQPMLLSHLCQIDVPVDVDAVVPCLGSPTACAAGQAWQPLLAIYHQRCLPAIAHRLASNQRRVQNFLTEVNVRPVPEPELRHVDPDLLSFVNVNDLAAYHRVRDFLAGTASRSQLLRAASQELIADQSEDHR